MDEIARKALLFDFYSPLLTAKQQEIFDQYYQQDFSLGEIAENQKVSRPAVFDLLHRTEAALNRYEEKLSLVQRHLEFNHILEDIQAEMTCITRKHNDQSLEQLEKLLKKLAERW